MTDPIPIIPISQSYECPIANKSVTLPCAVKTCMYNDPSSIKGCKYAQVHEALHRGIIPKEVKKKAVCQLFSLEEDDLAVAIRRVMNVLHANEFFNHLFEKSIMEARPKELALLAESEDKYLAWRPSAKKIPFSEMIATIDFLKSNLT